MALTKDGRHVLLGSNDGKLRYWDLRAEKESRAFAGPAEMVDGIAMTGDGRQAVVAGADGAVHVYELDAGKEIKTLKGHEKKVDRVALSARLAKKKKCARTGEASIYGEEDLRPNGRWEPHGSRHCPNHRLPSWLAPNLFVPSAE